MKVDLILVLGLSFFAMLMSPGCGAKVPYTNPSTSKLGPGLVQKTIGPKYFDVSL